MGKKNKKNKKSSNKQEERPLLKLIKNLVNFLDNEETTVLTNAQLQTILQKELNVDISSAHPLEVDVYMSILKTFLKQWPNWDIVGQAAQESKKDPKINIDKIMNREYENFKKYLKDMLDLSKDELKKNVAKLEEEDSKEQEGESTSNVVLEVCCTRTQLNKLFFTQPNPRLDDTIFNVDQTTSKVQQQVCKLEELLHWPNLCFHATVGPFEFVRTNKMHLQHTLINKKLGYSSTKQPKISTDVHSRVTNRTLLGSSIEQTHAINYFKSLINELPKRIMHGLFISNLLRSIVKDLTLGPKHIDQGNEYMYFPSRHAYVRYLKTDVNHTDTEPSSKSIDHNKYQLHLEEIITPSVMFKLKRNMVEMTTKEVLKSITSSTESWIEVECLDCDIKFERLYSMTDLKNHILYNHCEEPDVQCMKCKKEFTMRLMAFNCWKHECIKSKK